MSHMTRRRCVGHTALLAGASLVDPFTSALGAPARAEIAGRAQVFATTGYGIPRGAQP